MKHLLIIIACIVIFFLVVASILYYQLEQDVSPQTIEAETKILEEFDVKIQSVEGWEFLDIPNPYLRYPEAPIQLASQYKVAYMLVIPEIKPEDAEMTLDQFYRLVVQKINNEHEVIEMGELKKLESDWSNRGIFNYRSIYQEVPLKWYVQLDVTKDYTFRTIGWCAQDQYENFQEDFAAMGDSLQPTQGNTLTKPAANSSLINNTTSP